MVKKLTNFILIECLLLFSLCLTIYLINQTTISSGDTIPNTLLAFNLLENHRLDFDNFKTSYLMEIANGYFFTESIQGKLTSIYPIGTSIITFPLYLIFYIYLKLVNVSLEITSENFEVQRIFWEKLAATITTSISVVIFYLSSRLKFSRKISYLSTFIYAFATNVWVISSQGLWQHGPSNLALISILYCFLMANRKKSSKNWLLTAGILAGILPGIRPTNAIFSMASVLYSVTTFKSKSVVFFVGLISAIPSLIWNWYNFGNLTGGYSKAFSGLPYNFSFNHFSFTGLSLLFSPSRGLLIFSPILIYSVYGLYRLIQHKFKKRLDRDEQLLLIMTVASTILFLSYCFYWIWWAGHSYGPRFMTDLMPILCYLINYSLAPKKSLKDTWKNIIFCSLLSVSFFTQMVGAFGKNGLDWNGIPLNVDRHPERIWQIQDNQIQRHAKALFYLINKPDLYNEEYRQGLKGVIKEVRDTNNQIIDSFKAIKPSSRHLVTVKIINKGSVNWYGYAEAVGLGETRIRTRFLNSKGKTISESRLYVTGNQIKPKQETEAIGEIQFPNQPGKYTLMLDFISEGVAEFANSQISAYKTDVILEK